MKANRTNAAEVSRAVKPAVDAYLVARAHAELERERVDAIERAILAENVYMSDEKNLDGQEDKRITEPADCWLMCDADAKRYHAKLKAIHLANGFEDAAKGYCPALVAERLQTEAEWAIIEAAKPLLGIDNDQLLCGTKGKGGMECRQEYIDLLVKLVVNAPGYANPVFKSLVNA